ILIVPLQGEVVLVTRAMERVTIANQVRNARFEGHGDHETAAEAAARVLLALGPGLREIGTEQWSSGLRSEEHTSELQSLMRISYAVFCLKKKRKHPKHAT